MSSRITPATLAFADGVPYADAYGDVYHSADGGLDQARHVFIAGNRLPQRWRLCRRFSILETGFGLGLNFLATWQAWRNDAERSHSLHYVAIEKHPFRAADLRQLHARWPELDALSQALQAQWPLLLPGFHRLELEQGRVVLTLVFGDVAACLPQVDPGNGFDAFYLDGFAPSKNPDMWEPTVLSRLGRLAAAGATLASYTVAAGVRRGLGEAGFVCDKLPGFGRKRDMLGAVYAPRWPVTPPRAPQREAIVLGAGLAGCSISERLCARGWRVTLIERHAQPAQEISGNRAGIALPLLTQDDNYAARISRGAFLYALRRWRALGGIGQAFDGEACGVLQLAANVQEAQVQRNAAALFDDVPEWVTWLDAEQVAARFGFAAPHGGWLFPQGGWATPSSFCEALLQACGAQLRAMFGQQVQEIARVDGLWQVRDDSGCVLAAAPQLILANGNGARMLPATAALPLQTVRGQVTHVAADSAPQLPLVVCGKAYMTRAARGTVCIGATYDDDTDPGLREDSQHANLNALQRMLPQMPVPRDLPLAGRVGFRSVTPDRLPLVGAVPNADVTISGSRLRNVARHEGLSCLLGYGSRGLTWAALCAELLAAQLEGEALPIERELAEALDPARFALRAHRRNSTTNG